MAVQIRVIRKLRVEPLRMMTPNQLSRRPIGLPDGVRIGTGSTIWTSPPLPVPWDQIRNLHLVEPPGLPWALRIITY